MKKIFLLAIGLVVAISFLGGNSVLLLFQTVPVTVAQSRPVLSTEISVTAIAPTPTALPTLAPIVTAQPLHPEPAATIVAAEAITKAPTRTAEQALLDQFVTTVSGKGTDLVTGVYVPGQFSLPVLQQPPGDASFVSTQDNTATQFRSANAYGTVGLLAHNNLSGKKFFDLRGGEDVVIVYGNGNQTHYRITQIERYQALSPTSAYSDFIDLSDANRTKLTAGQVFQRIYTAENRVVFQTCIEANGDPSWGRIFVIAEKVGP